jgi:hypothetical protein
MGQQNDCATATVLAFPRPDSSPKPRWQFKVYAPGTDRDQAVEVSASATRPCGGVRLGHHFFVGVRLSPRDLGRIGLVVVSVAVLTLLALAG